MRILFSPVGTADPLTLLGDGPMLHIVRHYRPDKIVLFLSPKMAEFEQKDSKNQNALALLSRSMEGYSPEVAFRCSAYTEVHRYDFYIDEFAQALNQLDAENPGSEIFINVTSGTPAMQQALVAFDAFDSLGLRSLQVATPRADINREGDREDPHAYDLESLWALNPDNEPDKPSRCQEVESKHFKDLILRDNIRALVEGFDYSAACHLAQQSRSLSSHAIGIIEGSALRFNLEGQSAAKIFAGTSCAYDPSNQIAEYLWALEVRLARKQWTDFLCALTPALYTTCLCFLSGALPDSSWMKKHKREDGTVVRRIDSRKVLQSPELSECLPKITSGSDPYISNGHLEALIERFCPDVYRQVKSLRSLEEGARHLVAHTIIRIDKNALEKRGGMTLNSALEMLFCLNEVEPGLYRRINAHIVALL